MHSNRGDLESGDTGTTEGVAELLIHNIPRELKAENAWVPWKREYRNGKPTKIPYQVNRRRADSTNPATWTSFEDAVKAYERDDFFDGVGFVFHEGNPYCGADIDDVTEDQARHWIDRFDSYTERSPSGNGFHIICKAKVPKGTKRPEGELYSSGRFFTVTGAVVHDTPIGEAQDAAEEFYEFLRRGDSLPVERQQPATTSPPMTDAEIIRKAEEAKNGDQFSDVYRGGGQFPSGSERDWDLARKIVFWTQDEQQIERIMRGSGCARRKWDKHRTYLRDTIANAISTASEFYSPPTPKSSHDKVKEEFEDLVRGDGERPANMPYNTTDYGNAERLVARHGEDLRYVGAWRRWLEYDGPRWRTDDTGGVGRRAKETTRSIYGEAEQPEYAELRRELAKHAIQSEARSRIEAMVALAESEPGIPVRPDDLDRDPWLLNVENGTIDLRTGELREHRREDLITKLVPTRYDPDAKAPNWQAFLERVLPSEGLRRFVQRAVGYSLTGDTRERILIILHGIGRNGKSTFLETIREALGAEDGYAIKTPAETLMAKPAGGIPNDIARLKGARFVAASETERGRRLAEALVKEMTGNDTMSARFMRAEWFDFRPTHKVWLATNHKPEVKGTDPGIWDRIRLVPFDVRIPDDEIDRALPEKLRAELPGILAWAVRGCLDWQREGLGEPDEVREATEAYRSEMDTLAAFIEDRCVVLESAQVSSGALYVAYTGWCEENGERAETLKSFGSRLSDRGFERARGTGGIRIRLGLGLRSDREPEPEGGGDPTDGKGHSEKSPQIRAFLDAGSDPSDPSDPKSGMNNQNDSHKEKNPKSGSLRSLGSLSLEEVVVGPVASYLTNPPRDLLRQAEKCVEEGGIGSQLFKPLVSSVAYGVYGTSAGRCDEVRPAVEAWLRELLDERERDVG